MRDHGRNEGRSGRQWRCNGSPGHLALTQHVLDKRYGFPFSINRKIRTLITINGLRRGGGASSGGDEAALVEGSESDLVRCEGTGGRNGRL